jgi:hypothetical protein
MLTKSFPMNFAASQGLWGDGGSSVNVSERTGRGIGFYYSLQANTGTVNATQGALLVVDHPDVVMLGTPAPITLDFSGIAGGGHIESLFGAEAEAGIFIDISGCLGVEILGVCIGIPYDIDEDIDVIDAGFFLHPSSTHTPTLDLLRTATDSDGLFDMSVGLDLGIGNLGATMDFDLDQTISFAPTGLSGLMLFENLDYGQTFLRSFFIPTESPVSMSMPLGSGLWRVSLLDVILGNRFRNELDLALHPSLDYIIGSWNLGTIDIPLVEDSFALQFNRIARAGSFDIRVDIPEPASMILTGLGLLGIGLFRRRRRTPY